MALKTVIRPIRKTLNLNNNDLSQGLAAGAHFCRLRKPGWGHCYVRISGLIRTKMASLCHICQRRKQHSNQSARKRYAGALVIPLFDIRSPCYSCNNMSDKLLLNFGTKFQCLYYYLRNFCHFIGFEQRYFSLHVKITVTMVTQNHQIISSHELRKKWRKDF